MTIQEGLPNNIRIDNVPHIRMMSAHHLTDSTGNVVSMTSTFHDDRNGKTNILYIKNLSGLNPEKYMTPFQSPQRTIEVATRISLLETFGIVINQESTSELKLLPTIRQP